MSCKLRSITRFRNTYGSQKTDTLIPQRSRVLNMKTYTLSYEDKLKIIQE